MYLSTNAQYQVLNWFLGTQNRLYFTQQANLSNPFPAINTVSGDFSNNVAIISDKSGSVRIRYTKGTMTFFGSTTNEITTNPYSSTKQPAYIFYEDAGGANYDFIVVELSSNIDNGNFSLYATKGLQTPSSVFQPYSKLFRNDLCPKFAVYINSMDTSIIVHNVDGNDFYIYKTMFATNSPTTINIGDNYNTDYQDGYMKFSPNGTRLAVSSPDANRLDIYEYDHINTMLTEEATFVTNNYNAIEFSLDNQFLYVSADNQIFQINIAEDTIISIGVTDATIDNMQMGPDDRIYVSSASGNFLGIINNPEIRGQFCNFDKNGLSMNTSINGTLPIFPANYFQSFPYVTFENLITMDDTIFEGDEITFNLMSTTNINKTKWHFGDGQDTTISGMTTPTHTYNAFGIYNVSIDIFFDNKTPWDSVRIKKAVTVLPKKQNLITPHDTAFCSSFSVDLSVNNPPSAFNEWTDISGTIIGFNTNKITVDTAGYYIVTYYTDASQTDTIAKDTALVFTTSAKITISGVPKVNELIDFNAITTITPPNAISTDNIYYSWDLDDGSTPSGYNLTNIQHVYGSPSKYYLSLDIDNGYCFSDTIDSIVITNPSTNLISPHDSLICQNESIILKANTSTSFSKWYDYNGNQIGTNNIDSITIDSAGYYILNVYNDDSYTNIIETDMATIYGFGISVDLLGDNAILQDTFLTDEVINFTTYPNEQPDVFIDSAFYTWKINDSIYVQGYDSLSFFRSFDNSGNYIASLSVNYKSCEEVAQKNFTIVPNNDLIYPKYSTICDMNGSVVNLSVSTDFSDYNILWYQENGDTLLYGPGQILLDLSYYSGKIYVNIMDINNNIIDQDTAIVYYFEPDFNHSGSSVNQPVTFNATFNATPSPFNYYTPVNFNWNFGDNETENTNNTSIEHTYSQIGNYETILNTSIDGCTYSDTNTISINGGNQTIISPRDTSLCSISGNDQITFSVNYNSINSNITWHHKYYDIFNNETDYYLYAEDTNSITITKPGMYYVEVAVSANNVLIDSVYVDYENCDDYTAILSINGQTNEQTYCINSLDVDFDLSITLNQNNCSNDYSNFYTVWDFGDSTQLTGNGNFTTTHKYDSTGNYLVSVYIYDNKNCEKIIRKYVRIYNLSDTTIIYNIEKLNNQSQITVNIADIPSLNPTFYGNNYFSSSIDTIIRPANSQNFRINVSGSLVDTIKKGSDVVFFAKFAYLGDLNIKLMPPIQGTEIDVINTSASPNYFLYGNPNFNRNTAKLSKTKTYLFSTNSELYLDAANATASDYYFTPDNNFIIGDFYSFPSKTYKSEQMYNTKGEFVNGEWTFNIKGTTTYGKITSWGLIFNKDYFKTTIAPETMTCKDQFGYEYIMSNNQLIISNSGVTEYQLSCTITYPNSPCEITKNITVKLPETNPIPEYFTPNGDNINDYWLPVSPNVNATIVIIDKNGNIIANYKSSDKLEGWDGTTSNGKMLPSDSYWYIITLENGKNLKGSVTIVR